MDKGFIELFKEIARQNEIIAETGECMEMRDVFRALGDKLEEGKEPDYNDYVNLYFGAMACSNNLDVRLNALRKTIIGYQQSIIPSLEAVVKDKENYEEIAEEKFKLND